MKQHTNQYKTNISLLGRQQDVQIIYTIDDEEIILTNEDINEVIYSYDGSLIKSVMTGIEIDSNVEIPVGTEIQYKYGQLVGTEYEYLDYGKFIVKEVEQQKDTSSYSIICYDKILYSMVEYKDVEFTFPMTVRQYLNTICSHLGLTFANNNDEFCNYDKVIAGDVYLNNNYTFRDVLDDLAEVTGGTICINHDDQVEIRYPNQTNEIIDENYFKAENVNIGKKYGPINSIVLSRSAESDNVYIQDETSIELNGLCEIKIKDNQIMNYNDRSDYLPDLLETLGGIEYYLTDISSTGITYLELLDMYNISIFNEVYNCLMLNDVQDVTQGLEEQITAEEPETSVTDYSKADKTDQRINETYLIVDKQNQQIQAVISNVSEQNTKISIVEQTVAELNSKIQDIADITTSAESSYATVSLDNINESEPIYIKIRPIIQNISYLYPRNNLYPSNDLYMTNRRIRFTNTRENTYIDYELPDDLLYYDENNYDEFILNYELQICQVNKKCKYNADGTVALLDTPITNTYEYPSIQLLDGDYEITLLGYNTGYLQVKLMAENIYTTQFATKAEVSSQISQTATNITTQVNAKFTNYSTTTQMNSSISQSATNILSTVSNTYETKNSAQTKYSQLEQSDTAILSTVSSTYETKSSAQTKYSQLEQTDSSITATLGTKLNSSSFTHAQIVLKINDNTSTAKISADRVDIDATDVLNLLAGNTINLTSKNIAISSNNFSVDKNGNMTCTNATFTGGNVNLTDNGLGAYEGKLKIQGNTFITGLYSEGIVIRKIGSSTQSISPQSIFLTMYDGEPRLNMTSRNRTILSVTKSGFDYTSDNNVYFNVDGTNRQMSASTGTFYLQGNLNVTGSKNRVVKIKDENSVLLNAYETATPYFGDIGSNKTDENGYCRIDIEEIFRQTIELENYKVFIQKCENGDLYIVKYDTYFEVIGTPNLEFDWEIKAIQKGYKNTRLEKWENILGNGGNYGRTDN